VERIATEYIQEGMHLMTTTGHGLTPERCYDAVVDNGTYTIIVAPREEEDINRLLITYGVGSTSNNETRRTLRLKTRMITNR